MSVIGPGSMLLCVTTNIERFGVNCGSTYECASVEESFGQCGACGQYPGDGVEGVFLVGVPRPVFGNHFATFCTCAFVPAGRQGDFDEMLKFEPVKEDA